MSILSSTSGNSLSSLLQPSSSGPVAVGGLISGIDTNKLIQGLLAVEQAKIDNITTREGVIQGQQAAFKSLEAKLLAFQSQLSSLSRSQNSVFDAHSVQVSDPNAITAAASSSASAGEYHLRVNNLALANQIASQGFNGLTSSITHGTFSIKIGDTTTDIVVDGTNDTLQGLASAINTSGAAVTAAVINDGSGDGQQGYRLLLTSKSSGIANRIVLTNGLAGTDPSATKPLFDAASIGNATAAGSDTSTSVMQSNAGTGYTGLSNNVYTFTVVQGGTVGTDNGLQIAYTDTSGTHTGTITVDSGDVGVLKTVAEGIGVQVAAGTLVAGDTFTVKAFVPTVQAASDASITLGTGAGALNFTSATNKFDAAIPGVTMSVKQADPNHDITLSIANDTDGISTAIQSFVTSFNDAVSFIHDQTAYNSVSGQAGPLLGNLQVITIENQLHSIVQNVVAGGNPQLKHLGALGISTEDNGTLSLDMTKLGNILAGGKPGVDLGDVRKLFVLDGQSSNPGIQFIFGTSKTKASATPYTVEISQAAEQASVSAATALAASTVVDNTNNTLVVSVDGQSSGTITLDAGTYSRTALAQLIENAINASFSNGSRSVHVGVTSDQMSVTSNSYGAASNVQITSGSSLSALGFAGGETDQGLDVAGRFVVNAQVEAATGSRQNLTGNADNANTSGLQVRVTLTPAQVGGGVQADLTVTRGVASQLGVMLDRLFDPINGRLKTIDDGYNSTLDDLEKTKASITESMNNKQQQLLAQFNAMEQTLAQLQSSSNLLAQQAASLTQQKK